MYPKSQKLIKMLLILQCSKKKIENKYTSNIFKEKTKQIEK